MDAIIKRLVDPRTKTIIRTNHNKLCASCRKRRDHLYAISRDLYDERIYACMICLISAKGIVSELKEANKQMNQDKLVTACKYQRFTFRNTYISREHFCYGCTRYENLCIWSASSRKEIVCKGCIVDLLKKLTTAKRAMARVVMLTRELTIADVCGIIINILLRLCTI
jgi:hypothetical protein